MSCWETLILNCKVTKVLEAIFAFKTIQVSPTDYKSQAFENKFQKMSDSDQQKEHVN